MPLRHWCRESFNVGLVYVWLVFHWLTDARMCCRRKCWTRLVIWTFEFVFEFCDFVRDAEGSICLHKELFSYSFFACISVVCGWYLTKRWILSERSRVGAWGKFDAKTQQQIVRIGTKMAPKSTNKFSTIHQQIDPNSIRKAHGGVLGRAGPQTRKI